MAVRNPLSLSKLVLSMQAWARHGNRSEVDWAPDLQSKMLSLQLFRALCLVLLHSLHLLDLRSVPILQQVKSQLFPIVQ